MRESEMIHLYIPIYCLLLEEKDGPHDPYSAPKVQ